ncbi:MAG: TRAP transporter large permease subunit [Alphaproteobacteria bacterium]
MKATFRTINEIGLKGFEGCAPCRAALSTSCRCNSLTSSMYLGVATQTDAAALGVVGALGIAAAMCRLTVAMLHEAFLSTVRTTAMVVLVIVAAFILNFVPSFLGLPQANANWIQGRGTHRECFVEQNVCPNLRDVPNRGGAAGRTRVRLPNSSMSPMAPAYWRAAAPVWSEDQRLRRVCHGRPPR